MKIIVNEKNNLFNIKQFMYYLTNLIYHCNLFELSKLLDIMLNIIIKNKYKILIK